MMSDDDNKRVKDFVDKLISDNDVLIFSATYCRYCRKIKELFDKHDIKYFCIDIDLHTDFKLIAEELYKRTKQTSVPSIFVKGHHMGGCDDTTKKLENGTLLAYLEGKFSLPFEFDLIIIGGGSGGITAAKDAASLGKNVAIFDFVIPTKHGTQWGVGGTCVNVGCIPKKLMHQAAIIGDFIEDSESYGWKIKIPKKSEHVWSLLVTNVQSHIKKLNFNYLKYFKKNNIKYYNEFVTFKDIHTIEAKNRSGDVTLYTAKSFILAIGGRPHIPNFPGNEFVITSDDLFSLNSKPGKTLIVGSSYIGLECAGILKSLGVDCTVMVRSILLRGFDQQIAEMIGSHMESIGINFIKGCVPVEVKQGTWKGVDSSLKFKVTMKSNSAEINTEKVEYFNLVLMATGRDAATKELGLEGIGVQLNKSNGKVITDKFCQTTCHTVYAIGDVQDGHLELTPLAIKSAQKVIQKLYSSRKSQMDYTFIPTTVFTPLEYGTCGYSEEEAIARYGESDIECYHTHFQPYEWVLQNRNGFRCYSKIVCVKSLKMKVVGFHVLGPNAGEIAQGYTLALKLNATKFDFEQLVGIHPTSAEIFTVLNVTRAEQPEASETSC